MQSDLFTSEDCRIVDWQQAALTLDLSYLCMGDPTAVNKRHWIRVIYDVWQQTQGSAWNDVV